MQSTSRRLVLAAMFTCAAAHWLGACASGDSSDRPATTPTTNSEKRLDEFRINTALDLLHHAAAHADAEQYFNRFAPGAIFLGTDATERWTKSEFMAYCQPYFSKGKGWTYHPHDRHVTVGSDGQTAWFDEQLSNEKYGECRGSGVLIRTSDQSAPDGGWKIAQYNLTVPIPNDLMPKVADMIREQK